jgi:hypothetical protein
MFRKMNGQRGQALILITFAMIALIAMVGLAVDGSMAFSDRRHAQNAADTAALAGAMTKVYGHEQKLSNGVIYSNLVLSAMNMAAQNGFNSDLVSNTVEVFTCDMPASSCGPQYAGDPDYVQVIIHSRVETFFAGVIGVGEMRNRVQAVALAEKKLSGPIFNGDSIISLAQQCETPKNFSVEGNPNLTVTGGGLYVNSSDPSCGFTCNSNSAKINGNITTAGGPFDLSAKCEENIVGDKATDGDQWDFPVTLDDMGLEFPPECASPKGTYTNYKGTYPGYAGVELTVLTPGWYSDFPPKKEQPLGSLFDTILMLPGTYCVDNVVKLVEQKLTLIGEDVTFFLHDGNFFNLNGGTMKLDAPDTGPYAGYLMIVAPDYGNPVLSESPENCTINGGATNIFTGAIFAPYCNCTINGGSEPTGFDAQFICYTVKITGSAAISFTYDAGENPENNQPGEVGLIK